MPEPVRASAHQAPEGTDDKTVEGVGKLSEAFEYVERARGHLYSFHQLMGRADFLVEEAADLLREAGHGELAGRIDEELVGRNVLDGRWTFQVVEEYDHTYYGYFRDLEREVTDELMGGVRHVFEARLKERRRTRGEPAHEADPRG
ncbi:MAG TPA: hypothetical protein VFG72_03385 [Marmoricola sp.]|nr:hypothetical protein [Marmoricola sp.]